MSRPRLMFSALVVAVTFLAAVVVPMRPRESAADRAHRLWSECGLPSDEIDWLIRTFRGVDRQEALDSFYATFDHPKVREAVRTLRQRGSRRGPRS